MSNVIQALSAAAEEIGAVKKDGRNSAQGFSFRGIDAVVNAAAPAFRKHGIVVVPEIKDYKYEQVEVGKARTLQGHVMVTVCYRFYGPEGDSVAATVLAESMDSGDKAAAKAMSVAFRIALLQTLALPTDDADPDMDTYERSERPKLKPLTDEAMHAIEAGLTEAATIEALDKVALRIREYEMTDAEKFGLREMYNTRKTALTA